jgi:microcystin-dependent protein
MGFIYMCGFNWAPRSFYLCDGSILAISEFQALYSLLGTNYGGDGRLTFGLPDLRGRMPLGAGAGPTLTSRVMGQMGGQEDVTLEVSEMPAHDHAVSGSPTASATTAWQNASITSSATNTITGSIPLNLSGRIHGTAAPGNNEQPSTARSLATVNPTAVKIYRDGPMDAQFQEGSATVQGTANISDGNTQVTTEVESTLDSLDLTTTVNVSMEGMATENAGQGLAHDNMPPYTVVGFVIAVDGEYPSRN